MEKLVNRSLNGLMFMLLHENENMILRKEILIQNCYTLPQIQTENLKLLKYNLIALKH